jgi:hypothetical protein
VIKCEYFERCPPFASNKNPQSYQKISIISPGLFSTFIP